MDIGGAPGQARKASVRKRGQETWANGVRGQARNGRVGKPGQEAWGIVEHRGRQSAGRVAKCWQKTWGIGECGMEGQGRKCGQPCGPPPQRSPTKGVLGSQSMWTRCCKSSNGQILKLFFLCLFIEVGRQHRYLQTYVLYVG